MAVMPPPEKPSCRMPDEMCRPLLIEVLFFALKVGFLCEGALRRVFGQTGIVDNR